MADLHIQETDDGEVIVTTTKPTADLGPDPTYETLAEAEHDEGLLYRCIKAHQAYRDALHHALDNLEHKMARAEITEAVKHLADIMTDQLGPAYERATDEAERLDPDVSLQEGYS